jgi:hypothetical protein
MAVDAGHYSRRRRVQDARAAKEKRQKVMLAVGSALLLMLLAIQLPRTLHRLHGTSSAPTTSAGTGAPAAAAHLGATARARFAQRYAALAAFGPKDPFVQQEGDGSMTGEGIRSAIAPPVRATSFVVKDPFDEQVSSTGTSGPVGSSSVVPSRLLGGHASYVVVLASVPVPEGIGEARRIARFARAHGIKSASVLTSSNYRTLRSGFYVVYGGNYRSLGAALGGLASARTRGFLTAYTRSLGR